MSTNLAEDPVRRSGNSFLGRNAHWIPRSPYTIFGAGFLFCLLMVAIFAPFIAPHSPTSQDLNSILLPPSKEHLLGTDDLGRDVLSRLIYGTPVSLYASILAVGIAFVIGVPIGLAAGFFGGRIDDLISRILDTLLSFPAIVLAIGVTGALGIGLTNSMIAMGIVFSPILARLVRAQALIVKKELYIDTVRCFGGSPLRIVAHHILPNTVQPVIVQVTLLLATALLAEASLSFLGLGVRPPNPSWGGMLAKAYNYLEVAPEQMYAPGFAIPLTALAFNALGEHLRVALDPRSRTR